MSFWIPFLFTFLSIASANVSLECAIAVSEPSVVQLMKSLKFKRIGWSDGIGGIPTGPRGEKHGALFYTSSDHPRELYARFRNNSSIQDLKILEKAPRVGIILSPQILISHFESLILLGKNWGAAGLVLKLNSQIDFIFESNSQIKDFSQHLSEYLEKNQIQTTWQYQKSPLPKKKLRRLKTSLNETVLPSEFDRLVKKLEIFPTAYRQVALRAARFTLGLEKISIRTAPLSLVSGNWPLDPRLKTLTRETMKILDSPRFLSQFFLEFFYDVGLVMQENPRWSLALEKGILPREVAYEVFQEWHKQMGYKQIGSVGDVYLGPKEFRSIIKNGAFTDSAFVYESISHGLDAHVFQLFFVWKTLRNSGRTDFSDLLMYLAASDENLKLWNDLFDNPHSRAGRFSTVELLTEIYTMFTGLR